MDTLIHVSLLSVKDTPFLDDNLKNKSSSTIGKTDASGSDHCTVF